MVFCLSVILTVLVMSGVVQAKTNVVWLRSSHSSFCGCNLPFLSHKLQSDKGLFFAHSAVFYFELSTLLYE